MKIAVLKKDDFTLVKSVEVADSLRARLVGLLGRDALGRDRAMHLTPCNCIHTFFMKFPLDVVFLDKALRVTTLVWDVPAGRIVNGGLTAYSVLEMEAGWFPQDSLKEGDTLTLYR